jgi:hypothetical protein
MFSSTYLLETDRSRFFTETLTAKIKTVFANETSLMRTEAAAVPVFNKKSRCVSQDVPLPTTLPKFAWTREPDGVVCHFGLSSEP